VLYLGYHLHERHYLLFSSFKLRRHRLPAHSILPPHHAAPTTDPSPHFLCSLSDHLHFRHSSECASSSSCINLFRQDSSRIRLPGLVLFPHALLPLPAVRHHQSYGRQLHLLLGKTCRLRPSLAVEGAERPTLGW